jgi:DNA-binding GntR family transcriptional regulator
MLDREQVDVIYQMRERLEPLALGLSVPLLTAPDVDHLRDVQDRIVADTDLRDFLLLDREFHLATYARCPSETLLGTVTRLWNATQHHRRIFMRLTGPSRRWVVDCEHRLLLDAIERRDVVDAERYLAGHIRRTRTELARHPEVFDSTGA